ncbi:hypothetical protein G8759_31215 [Spirosoma aureum]|uniref:Uncharacterized protein n=1 Tax=Spirosoma aureum TaxID=2692134 RepID=A0A6G9AWQ0_9BACT|nr:hypothetical protein [Spirosoma aureum]QIP16794.1 hypothetical protein G8759_31215 [Spirosoma aureum]
MAHPCCICGEECYCHGDIDDCIVSLTPAGCISCGCTEDETYSNDEWDDDRPDPNLDTHCPVCNREYDAIDYEFQICHICKYENTYGNANET